MSQICCFGTEQHTETKPHVVHTVYFRYFSGSLYTPATWPINTLSPALSGLLQLTGSRFKSKEHHTFSCANQTVGWGTAMSFKQLSASCRFQDAGATARLAASLSSSLHSWEAGQSTHTARWPQSAPQHPTSRCMKGRPEKRCFSGSLPPQVLDGK